MTYDVIVIGGGPAGLMAAAAAAEAGARTLLLDKGNKLGRKLTISGGGRCNVTNAMPVEQLIRHIPGNGRFLYSALSAFDNQDIIAFFEKLGIKLKEEDHGRMFPVSNQAASVVHALIDKLHALHVTIKTDAKVAAVLYEGGRTTGVKFVSGEKIGAHQVIVAVGGKSVPQTGSPGDITGTHKRAIGVKMKNGEVYYANSVIVAVGGKSVPATGSTGDGYKWAEAAGHKITELYPTEVPLTSNEPFIQKRTLQGISLRDTAVTLLAPNGKPIMTHRWDMLFTHFGLSGPAILRLSQFVVKALKKYQTKTVDVRIDIYPDLSEDALTQKLETLAQEEPDKALKNVWKPIAPERYLLFLMEQLALAPETTGRQLRRESIRQMAALLKTFTVQVNGTLSIEKAFITGGGVSLKEINPKTMESKLMPRLYFCGEILDIHGYTGGYNITAAFTTGHAAGIDASKHS